MRTLLFSLFLVYGTVHCTQAQMLYNKDGMVVSLTTAVIGSAYCEDRKANLYHLKFRFTVSNESSSESNISFSCWTPTDYARVQCEDKIPFNERATQSGSRTYSFRLKPADQSFYEMDEWLYSTSPKPGWDIKYRLLENNAARNVPNTIKKPAPGSSKPVTGLSQEGDFIDLSAKERADADRLKKQEQVAEQERLKNIRAAQARAAKTKEEEDRVRKEEERSAQLKRQGEKEEEQRLQLEKIKQESEDIQQRYLQTQRELDNAKNVSMSAYEKAKEEGNTESYSIAKATLEGAAQIDDPTASLAYTGVGLALSLFSGAGEKRRQRENEYVREKESYQRKTQQLREERLEKERQEQLVKIKLQFLADAQNINKYSLGDLVNKQRYMCILLTPKYLTHETQTILFSLPLPVEQLKDGTYPFKKNIEADAHSLVDKGLLTKMNLVVLYPVVNVETFNSDFVKKMGSGRVINFDASLITVQNQRAYKNEPSNSPAKPPGSGQKDTFWNN